EVEPDPGRGRSGWTGAATPAGVENEGSPDPVVSAALRPPANGYDPSGIENASRIRAALLPPLPASAYDHNDPAAGAIYALPSGPSLYLADDWRGRASEAGAIVFDATADRTATIQNLVM